MRFSTYTFASAVAAVATAQTFTDCNPMEKTCPNNPAMPQTWETDFTAGKDAVKGWKQTAGSLTYGSEGADFVVAKKGDAPTIGSETFLHFGYVEVVMKAAPGVGIISSIVLQSDNLDEVDWEWIGGVDSRVQMNYFGKGNVSTYDRMIEADVANNQNDFHKYALNWTAESLTWIIDDKPIRTLNFADANGGKNYPQTPCNVRLGNWPGGDSENEGTRQWAGGNVTYADAPFTMTVKSIKVINYSPGTEYKWTDKSGDFESIEVIGAGNTEGAPQNTIVIKPSATATAAPIESGVDAPTATEAPSNSDDSDGEDSPCECGTATVTVTGAPPAIFTTEYPAVHPSSILTLISSAVETPLPSSVQVPIVTSAAPSSPPYPTTGLEIDTRSAPVVIAPSAPTGALPQPSGNATVSAPGEQFTGAASQIRAAGAVVGAVAGAVLFAF
ncbi:concanavalin A-like lectin/glucanase [Decorospora gaudefroyi]|uniref:chitinase n=1 Tax=Decorospora gaudefroyi TaxID=184978 RepID=A0A6A5KJI0_9PLEO|nr:concanavalin A-like lectin/glucanase [Decorospora gaudefroyi]